MMRWVDVPTRSFGLPRLPPVGRRIGRHLVWIGLFAVPAVILWWHVWTGHPSSTLTCACGDPAQEVWFMAWPAWALSHFANLFFSGAVNMPAGANLLSNTSGTLVGLVMSPVTWLWGPVVSTNLALTLAPAVSAWGCWLALRPLVTWKPSAVPPALVYGYSSGIVTALAFAHVSVVVLVVPPLLFSTLHEIVIRQEHTPWRDGLLLAALVVVQFLISPEVLVMCLLFAAAGLVAVAAVGWREVPERLPHAGPALGIGLGLSVVLLAYPAWFGLAGPQSVSGTLFAIAPLSGVPLSGFLLPGRFESLANTYVRFGGYLGRLGPPPNYLGLGVIAASVGSVVLTFRRPLVWLLAFLTGVACWISLGAYLLGGPPSWERIWMPWRYLSNLPVLKEILPDQFAPFISLFVAFILALGLDALIIVVSRPDVWTGGRAKLVAVVTTTAFTLLALIPVFVTFDMPFTVVPTEVPVWMQQDATKLPAGSVLLTIPYAVSGSSAPMLWQAVDGLHFRLAGAALKTPNASGGPVDQGTKGSALSILSALSIYGTPQPFGNRAEVDTVRRALRQWHVNEVVIDGRSRDPVYASGFMTMVFGRAPIYQDFAWVWKVPRGGVHIRPALGGSLYLCRLHAFARAQRHHPMFMSRCVIDAEKH
jgi:hypothetical protein